MEKVIELIREWHEQKRIDERKERIKEVFREVFGVDPVYVGFSDAKIYAVYTISKMELEEFPPETKKMLYEIVNTHVSGEEIEEIVLKVVEEPRAEEITEWESYWGSIPDYYRVVRRRFIKGYEVKIIIEVPRSYDC